MGRLKVGDKVKIPKTKLGGVIRGTVYKYVTKYRQDHLFVTKINKRSSNDIIVLNYKKDNTGDFFHYNEVFLYDNKLRMNYEIY